VPSGRAIADVVPERSLAQFTDAKQQVFSAARHRMAFSWNVVVSHKSADQSEAATFCPDRGFRRQLCDSLNARH
jgi:hypothetical protein